MRFNVYGRFHVEVQKEDGAWVVYRLEAGRRARLADVVIPASLTEPREIATCLDDLLHELSAPGDRVEILS
jgi:hypothetical protein